MDSQGRSNKLIGQAIWSLAAFDPRSVTKIAYGDRAANNGESKSWVDGVGADGT